MVLTQLTKTVKGTQTIDLNSFSVGEQLAFVVDSATDVDAVVINMKGAKQAILQLVNQGANSLTFTLYGSVKDTVPAAFDAKDFVEEVAAEALATAVSVVKVITKPYSWLLIRVRETSGGSDTTLDTVYKGSQR